MKLVVWKNEILMNFVPVSFVFLSPCDEGLCSVAGVAPALSQGLFYSLCILYSLFCLVLCFGFFIAFLDFQVYSLGPSFGLFLYNLPRRTRRDVETP